MERRVLLAVVLSFVTVFAWSSLTGQCSPMPPKDEAGKDGAPAAPGAPPAAPGVPGAPPVVPGVPGVPGGPVAAPGAPAPAPLPVVDVGPGESTKIENEKLEVGLTTRGAAVEWIAVKDAHDSDHPGAPLVIVAPADLNHLIGTLDDTGVVPGTLGAPTTAGPMRNGLWTRDVAAEGKKPEERDVVYRFTLADGRVVTKQWLLPTEGGRYDLRLRIVVTPVAGTAPPASPGAPGSTLAVNLLVTGGLVPEGSASQSLGAVSDANYKFRSMDEASIGNPYEISARAIEMQGLERDRLEFLAARSQYFLVGAYAAPDAPPLPVTHVWATGEDAMLRPAMGERLKAWFAQHTMRVAEEGKDAALVRRLVQARDDALHSWMRLELPVGPNGVEVALFAGPVDRNLLRSDRYASMKSLVTYPGAWDWVADFLLWIYDRWLALFGSVGLAVVLMTLTVRGSLMPLSIRNQLGMRRYGRKVQKLKPKIKALQEKFANNPKRLREEQMLLYRENGIGFPTGCLMMLIQIPIFFALFGSLRVEYTLRGESFLWIPDLSGPDRLIDLPAGFFLSSINLLPLVMVALSIVQMRFMPVPTDEQQAQQMRMMKWMPILFAVILYTYTAALTLYMVVSSCLALIESRVVKRRDERELAEAAA